jgi:hypothetical protein
VPVTRLGRTAAGDRFAFGPLEATLVELTSAYEALLQG